MKQITLITENRSGVIAEISESLAKQHINIESLDAETFKNSAVIILTVDRYDEALHVINKMPDLKAITEDAIVVKIKDEPGALAYIAKRFKDADINIRSIRIIRRNDGNSLAAICTERTDEAMKLVADILVS